MSEKKLSLQDLNLIRTMQATQATLNVTLHLGCFRNIDLPSKGVYRVSASIRGNDYLEQVVVRHTHRMHERVYPYSKLGNLFNSRLPTTPFIISHHSSLRNEPHPFDDEVMLLSIPRDRSPL